MTSESFKQLGNKAFSEGNFKEAIGFFDQAIQLDSNNHILYSNVSAAYASSRDYDRALEAAEKAVTLKPDWAKGWGRKGAALMGLKRYEDAKGAYQKGLELDPSSALLKKGLDEAAQALESDVGGGIGKLFSGDVWTKIAANPKTAHLLADRDFTEKVRQIQQNPSAINLHLQDPRIMTVMMVLMGIDANVNSDVEMSSSPPPEQKSSVPKSPDVKDEEVKDRAFEDIMEIDEEAKNRQKALLAKDRGNGLYKQRKFDEALVAYAEAIELDPNNMSLYNNQAAVYFEMGDFQESIKRCEKAIDIGREHRADFKMIAKALGRIGSAYLKLEDFDNAIKYYNKSLTEHRTADILNKLKETEKLKKEKERASYRNPELADSAREEGNHFFKNGEWAKAVERYTESIKRNEDDPRAYSNRAACYTKLMAFQEALKDCEKCIQLDPTFVKGYIRKAAIEFLKKEYPKCLESCEQAMAHDKDGKHKAEIEAQMYKCYAATQGEGSEEEARKRVANDPELQQILADPIMRQILEQMQQDPRAAQDHLKNPVVAAKIKKLIAAGIIRMG